MIIVQCDICEKVICSGGTGQDITGKWEIGDLKPSYIETYFQHVCDNCVQIFSEIDIQELYKNAILDVLDSLKVPPNV